MKKLTFKDLIADTGTLSAPSKMPCHGTSTSAYDCKVGGFLRTIKGSVCSKCYACTANYQYPSVKQAHADRLSKITGPNWVESMAEHITRRCEDVFRWHDSGDLQSAQHLRRIVAIARLTPNIQHWLPTKEFGLVLTYLRHGNEFPDNLTVRISAPMMGALFQKHTNKTVRKLQEQFEQLVLLYGLPTSTVDDPDAELTCPAKAQAGKCLDCRRCWDKSVANVNYIGQN